MKRLLLVLAGAALFSAGCSSNSNSYATYGEFGYTFDLVPQPVPGITVDEVHRLYGTAQVVPSSPQAPVAGRNLFTPASE